MIHRLARLAALAGGAVLLAMIAMTCVSILGRAGFTLGAMTGSEALSRLRPLRGDVEMVELGSAVAICAFLPWAALTRAHARVDLWAGRGAGTADRLWGALMVVALLVMLRQTFVGMMAKRAAGEVTFLLQWPVWWAYAGCVAGLAVAAAAALWVAIGGEGQGEDRGDDGAGPRA